MILPIGEKVKIKTGKNHSKYVMGIVTLRKTESDRFTAIIKLAPGFSKKQRMIKRLKHVTN